MGKIKGPEIGYTDILDYFTSEATKDATSLITKDPRRPSSTGKCGRELAYQLMEYTNRVKYPRPKGSGRAPEVTRLLSLGHYVERSTQDQFDRYVPKEYITRRYSQKKVRGFEVTSEEDPSLNHHIQGDFDDIYITEDGYGLIDYKSKKDKFNKFHATGWQQIDETITKLGAGLIGDSDTAYWVDDIYDFVMKLQRSNEAFFAANFWQLNFYANTDWAKEKGVDHCSIIQINKNDSRLREVRFAPSEKLYLATQDKFQKVTHYVGLERPEDVPRDFEYGSIKCAFCEYRDTCYEGMDKDANQAFLDKLPNKNWPKDVVRLPPGVKKEFEALYKVFTVGDEAMEEYRKIKTDILKLMEDHGINKIRFADGKVYIRKFLKSPFPHYELRRSKV